jgi:hypothetical protein
MWFILFLTAFHSYLVSINQTTNEYLKKIWKKSSNPFSYRSCIQNIGSVLCKGLFPEHFDLQRPIDLILDTISISPSKQAFVSSDKQIVNAGIDKLNTDSKNSPRILASENRGKKYRVLDIIESGKI